MSNVIRLSDHVYEWKQIYASDGASSTIQFYMNAYSGEIEVVQMNDEGEAIRTVLDATASGALSSALKNAHDKIRR